MTSALIAELPQSTRDHIKEMYDDEHTFREIHEWILSEGASNISLGMTQYWCRSKHGPRHPDKNIVPADTYEERMVQYIDAILAENVIAFTHRRLRLRGSVWGQCTRALKCAGLIVADNAYGSRYRLLVTHLELRRWRDANIHIKSRDFEELAQELVI